jgi:putative FmdB family regulatory protein
MPLYEYQCTACGKEFEQIIRLSEAHINPACPACQRKETRKKISVFAAHGTSSTSTSTTASSACTPRGGFS